MPDFTAEAQQAIDVPRTDLLERVAAALAAAYQQSPKELVAFIEREIRCVPPSEWATTKLALDRVLMFAKQLAAAPVSTAQEPAK